MEPKNTQTIADKLREYQGQPMAIWAMRYTYRGIVTEVGEDFVTLKNPRAVEVTGISTNSQPQTEDPIPSDLTISLGAIEQFCQPSWVWHEMEVERTKV